MVCYISYDYSVDIHIVPRNGHYHAHYYNLYHAIITLKHYIPKISFILLCVLENYQQL